MRTISFLIAAVLLIGVPAAHAAKDKTKVTATWVAPAAGSVLTAPATIVLSVDAKAKQSNHPIVSVEFYNGATLLGSQTAPLSGLNYQLIWLNVTPGTYWLTATATNDKGDFDTTDPVTITVIKANQTLTGFNPTTPITWAPNTRFIMTATGGASGNPITVGSTTPSVCIVSGNVATVQSAGACTLTADQAGNINYNPAPQATAKVTINKADQAITGFNPATLITYAPGITIILSAVGGASGNPVTFGSSTPTVCSVSGNVATVLSAGTCTLTADQAGNINYHPAPQATAKVTINKADQAITGFAPTSAITYASGGAFMLTAMGGASGNPVAFGSTTPSVCGVSGNTATVLSAGACNLTADQAGNTNYNAAAQMTATVVINTAPTVALTAPANNSSFFAPASIALTAAASDADGSIAKVEFFQGATLIGTATTAPYTFIWNNVAEGIYVLTARATDNLGASTTSSAVTVKVNLPEAGIYYIHADHLGTPRAITRPSDNAVVWKNDNSEPFGNSQPDENPSGLGAFTYNLRFPGQYFDVETGTDYNYMRDYDPSIGRYIQSDPIGLMAGTNTYSYVGNNPLRYIDPLGLQAAYICTKLWHPHTFLCVDENCSGKYPSGNPFFSPGQIRDDSSNKSSASCSAVPSGDCDPISFAQCVSKRLANRGSSGDYYNYVAASCGQWAEDVITQCRRECSKK